MAVLVQRLLPNVVCVGESLTSGSQSTGGVGGEGSTNSYPGQLATTRGQTYGGTIFNLGVGGIGVDSLLEPELFLRAGKPNVCVVMEGINDFFNAGTSNSVIFPKLQTYINARVAAGWRVVVCTLTKVGLSNPTAQTYRTAYNSSIRSAYTGGAVSGVTLCDVAASSLIGDSAVIDGTYFAGDSYHLNNAGYGVLAGLINAVLPTSWQLSPTLTDASGANVLANSASKITGWFRADWTQRNTSTAEAFTMHNFAAKQCFLRYLQENNQAAGGGHVQVTRVDSVLNGKPVLRFPGNQSSGSDLTAYASSSTTLSSFVASTSAFIWAVLNPTSIAANSVNPHFNEAVLAVSGGFGCGLTLRNNGGTYQVQCYTDDGAKQIAATTLTTGIGANVAIFGRLTGGKVGVRVGTQGSWTEVTSGAISDLTGALSFGKASQNCLNADVAEVGIGQWDSTDDTNLGAYIRARYGGSL